MNDRHPTGDPLPVDPAPHLSYPAYPAAHDPSYQQQGAPYDDGTGYDGYQSGEYGGYQAGYATGSYDTSGYDSGAYGTGGYDTSGYGASGYDTGTYDAAGYATGVYETGVHDVGCYETGSYAATAWPAAEAHWDAALPHDSVPDQAGYGFTAADSTGQWDGASWDSGGRPVAGAPFDGSGTGGAPAEESAVGGWGTSGAETGAWTAHGWDTSGSIPDSAATGWDSGGWGGSSDTGAWDTSEPGTTSGGWGASGYATAAYGTGEASGDLSYDPLSPLDPAIATGYHRGGYDLPVTDGYQAGFLDTGGLTDPYFYGAAHDTAQASAYGHGYGGSPDQRAPADEVYATGAQPSNVADGYADFSYDGTAYGHDGQWDSAADETTHGFAPGGYPDQDHPVQDHPAHSHPVQNHPVQADEYPVDAYPPEQPAADRPPTAAGQDTNGPEFAPEPAPEPEAPLAAQVPHPRQARHPDGGPSHPGARSGRRRTPVKPRRSALLTVAVPSAAVLGVSCVAAAAITVPDSDEDRAPQAQQEPNPNQVVKANNKLDTQLSGLTRDANDFADRANRTQERIDLKERQEAERKRKEAEAARLEELRPKFALPVAQHGLSAYYGQSGINWSSLHTGIDFPVSYGTPVLAATDGTVRTQWNYSYGNMVIVTAADGTETWYCHLDSSRIRSGSVKAGDTIGYSGNSGTSTGPHLHFEVRPYGGDPIDPLVWLRDKGLEPT